MTILILLEILQKLKKPVYLVSIFALLDFHARHFRLRENEVDLKMTTMAGVVEHCS